MLGVTFKLTPAQVKFLMLMKYGKEYRDGFGSLELVMMSSYIATSDALTRKGLVSTSRPAKLTEEGSAMASLIYQHAKSIVEMVEQSETFKKQKQLSELGSLEIE